MIELSQHKYIKEIHKCTIVIHPHTHTHTQTHTLACTVSRHSSLEPAGCAVALIFTPCHAEKKRETENEGEIKRVEPGKGD